MSELSKIRHTLVELSEETEYKHLQANIHLEEKYDMIASNRIDCIIAKAFHLSRSESAELLAAEKVFKTKDFYNLAVLYWKLENSNTIGLAVIFACRCGFEFFFYFYTTYIAYSYAKKSKPELLEKE
jgi:hypothetical protein